MKQISEDILIRALKLQDEGLSLERIFAAFSAEEARDLKQYFNLIADLRAEAAKIDPPSREVLHGALRRAAATRVATRRDTHISKVFGYIPFGLRLFAPVLVVLFLVVFVDRSRVIAPGQEAREQEVGEQEILEQMTAEQAMLENKEIRTMSGAQDIPAGSADAEALAPMSAPASMSVPAPMAAKSFAGAETTPSGVADQIVQAYIANDVGSADFKLLEELLAEASEKQKQALADFRAALDKAYANRETSLKDFEAEANAAGTAFKNALGQ